MAGQNGVFFFSAHPVNRNFDETAQKFLFIIFRLSGKQIANIH